jgi:hypothetical protein
LREDRFVPIKGGEAVELAPLEILEKFGLDPSNRLDVTTVRMMVPGSFIGLLKNKHGKPVRFYFKNDDLSADVGWIINRDPTFSSRLVEVWMVEHSVWDSKVTE